MTTKEPKLLSKKLSFYLRHEINKLNINDEYGYIYLNQLVELINSHPDQKAVNKQEIIDYVKNEKKQRFKINREKIKANYGHSFDINKEIIEKKELPDYLYATFDKNFFSKETKEFNKRMFYFFQDKSIALEGKNKNEVGLYKLKTDKLPEDIKKEMIFLNGFWQSNKRIDKHYFQEIKENKNKYKI